MVRQLLVHSPTQRPAVFQTIPGFCCCPPPPPTRPRFFLRVARKLQVIGLRTRKPGPRPAPGLASIFCCASGEECPPHPPLPALSRPDRPLVGRLHVPRRRNALESSPPLGRVNSPSLSLSMSGGSFSRHSHPQREACIPGGRPARLINLSEQRQWERLSPPSPGRATAWPGAARCALSRFASATGARRRQSAPASIETQIANRI